MDNHNSARASPNDSAITIDRPARRSYTFDVSTIVIPIALVLLWNVLWPKYHYLLISHCLALIVVAFVFGAFTASQDGCDSPFIAAIFMTPMFLVLSPVLPIYSQLNVHSAYPNSGWWIPFAVYLGVFAIAAPIAKKVAQAIAQYQTSHQKCPACEAPVKPEANVCQNCWREIPGTPSAAQSLRHRPQLRME